MIARPIHRPRPIPFDTSAPAQPSHGTAANQPRAISWGAAVGPGMQAPGICHHAPSRLSPVKAPLPLGPAFGQTPPASPQATARRPSPALTAVSGGKPASNDGHQVGGPRQGSHHGGSSMSEISARYIGHGALSVRSSVTGRHYRFQGHGDSLVIDRNDVVLLKRISDLVIR